MSDQSAPNTPQFNTAEYVGTPGEDRCRFCNQLIPQQYYRVGNAMACGSCAQMARHQMPVDSHAAFVRALIFGIGAAIVGLIGYSAFGIYTGIVIGYLSLAVGYIIAKAMMYGSKGLGGRRYQIAAVLLTYAAVSMSAIPISISYMREQKKAQQQKSQEQQQLESESGQQNAEKQQPKMSFGAAVGYLAMLGLASPFLELMDNPVSGLIGLVILFVGIRIAWRATAGRQALEIEGPFETRAAKPA